MLMLPSVNQTLFWGTDFTEPNYMSWLLVIGSKSVVALLGPIIAIKPTFACQLWSLQWVTLWQTQYNVQCFHFHIYFEAPVSMNRAHKLTMPLSRIVSWPHWSLLLRPGRTSLAIGGGLLRGGWHRRGHNLIYLWSGWAGCLPANLVCWPELKTPGCILPPVICPGQLRDFQSDS